MTEHIESRDIFYHKSPNALSYPTDAQFPGPSPVPAIDRSSRPAALPVNGEIIQWLEWN